MESVVVVVVVVVVDDDDDDFGVIIIIIIAATNASAIISIATVLVLSMILMFTYNYSGSEEATKSCAHDGLAETANECPNKDGN